MRELSRFFLFLFFSYLFLSACQGPTRVTELDSNSEQRLFKRSRSMDLDIKKAVIIDVRPRFEFEMAKLPRSFHALAEDWDLYGYQGVELQRKSDELTRLLALQGVDPLTQVGILGRGLKGKGEEFLMAATLQRLGVKRVIILDSKKMQQALSARNLPSVENLPRWQKPLGPDWVCSLPEGLSNEQRLERADLVIGKKSESKRASSPKKYFNSQMQVRKNRFPKSLKVNIHSLKSYWSYGLVIYLREQARMACVIR